MAHFLLPIFRDKRISKGITADELAERIGLSPVTVRNAERGDQPIKIEKIARAAEVLNTPLEELFETRPTRAA